MAVGKLILNCQSGGDFVRSDDGSLTYIAGKSQPVTVTSETLYDDLKLRLAELCDFDFKSVSTKYFLPGNTRTLITLASDKDLRRMLEFQKSCTTADVFVAGQPGFSRDILDELISRETSIIAAKPVEHVDMPVDASGPDNSSPARVGNRRKYAARRKAIKSEDSSLKKETRSSSPRSRTGAETNSNSPLHSDGEDIPIPDASKVPKEGSIEIDMSASLVDTVKKRKRTASKKGASYVAEEGRSQKKKKQIAVVDDEADQCKEEDYHLTDSGDDVSAEEKIAIWKRRITGVGQDFKNVEEFRDALQKYAIAHRFEYRLRKNETIRAIAVCVGENCSWEIMASSVPGAGTFRVRKFSKSHSCDKESRKSPHPKKKWLVNTIKDRLRDSPYLTPKVIANGIAKDFGIELNYSQVWRCFGQAKEQLQGSSKLTYNDLPSYCEKFTELYPGSFADLLTDNEKRFRCLFIALRASIHGFQCGCRPLLFLEATPLKSKYQEVVLTATSLDGNDSFFPVAFAVVDSEYDDNWQWFLQELKSSLPGSGPITFVYNREKGLRDTVLKVFPDAHHGYNMFHLKDSFWRSFKGPFHGEGRTALPGYFFAAAQTPRLAEFKRFTEQINRISPKVHDWVQQIEPECWTTSACKGEIHNHITENIAEPYIKVIEESKGLFITQKIDAITNMIIELMNDRRDEASECSETLMPSKAERLSEEAVAAQGLRVLVSSDTVFEVHDEAIHVVDLTILDCTCLRWQTSRLPCRHAIAVFNFTGRNVHDYCSRYFMAETLLLTYSEPIIPVQLLIKDAGEVVVEEGDAGEKVVVEEEKGDAGEKVVVEEKEGAGEKKEVVVEGGDAGEKVVVEEKGGAGEKKEVVEGGDAGEKEEEDATISVNVLPPCPPRTSSNAKENKQRKPRATKWIVICSRCKEAGHNKKSCKLPE